MLRGGFRVTNSEFYTEGLKIRLYSVISDFGTTNIFMFELFVVLLRHSF